MKRILSSSRVVLAWIFLALTCVDPSTADSGALALPEDRAVGQEAGLRFLAAWAAEDRRALTLALAPTTEPDELARRLGPATPGSRWSVVSADRDTVWVRGEHTTGWWSLARLDLDAEGRVVGARSLAELGAGAAPPAERIGRTGDPGEGAGATTPGSARIALVAAAVLLALALALRRFRVVLLPLALAAGALGVFWPAPEGGAGGGDPVAGDAGTPEQPGSAGAAEILARLGGAAAERSIEALPAGPEKERARLERILQRLETGDAPARLGAEIDALPAAASSALGHLLRATVAVASGREVDAALAIEALLDAMPAAPLRREIGVLWAATAFPDRAEAVVGQGLAAHDLDEAELHRLQARLALAGDLWKAERHLLDGWRLRPLPRDELLSDPGFAFLVGARGPLRKALGLSRAVAPRVACASAAAGASPMPWSGVTVGQELVLFVGDREVVAPRGCGLAPDGAREVSAEEARQLREDRLLALAGTPGTTLRGRFLGEAAEALARRDDWEGILRLVPGTGEPIPLYAAQLRARALRHVGREQEAIPLLVSLAEGLGDGGLAGLGPLVQLAEQLRAVGVRDRALRLLEAADRRAPEIGLDRRILQLRIEQRLVSRAVALEIGRFRFFYPPGQSAWFVRGLASLLGAEADRLSRWIPPGAGGPIDVLLLTGEDFRRAYGDGGPEIAGLWDGMIRVPYGDVGRLTPEMVTVLTHELAHALIADATRDRAPRWLHEGLAQHVQLLQPRTNPLPGLEKEGGLVAVPLLESTLGGFSHPELVGIAYEEALWVVHFVESRWGVDGIRRLLEASREGDPGSLVERALGPDPAAFQDQLLQWSRDEAPRSWPLDRVTLADYLPPPPPGEAAPVSEEQILEALAGALVALFEAAAAEEDS